ncbi:MAG TPA: chemotaxis protein CheB [Amycolatopsis sp.]|nr:chemotaxis protein CheB [Amycolatopsis sp.]
MTRSALTVLLIGGSPGDRILLTLLLESGGDIAVAAEAATSGQAVPLIARFGPDAIVLRLPRDDEAGLRAVKETRAHTAKPILVLTGDRGSAGARAALDAGAAEVLPANVEWAQGHGSALRQTVREMCAPPAGRPPARCPLPTVTGERAAVVAVAASTGGPSALATLLHGLADLPAPVLVVQHLHPEFTERLAAWMSRVSALPVAVAEHGQFARPGRVYLAPGGHHLRVGSGLRLQLGSLPATAHRPSADELFGSVAERAGAAAVGVLLTGIGDDGARGLLAIRSRGGRTLAQDEASSAVFGMPEAARRLGAVSELLPVTELAAAIGDAVRKVRS